MTKETLLLFIKRLLETGNDRQSILSLGQLKGILEAQGADPALIELAEIAIDAIPEAKHAAEEARFSEEHLRIAQLRAKERKERQARTTSMGRC